MLYSDREHGLLELVKQHKCKIGIEIGVRTGAYSKLILQETDIEKLYLLDCFPYPNMLPETLNNLKNYTDRIEIINGFSPQYSVNFQDNFFDFIYIDANHSYEYVKQDLIAWFSKLKVGGIFAGDDYTYVHNPGEGLYGVVQAVDEFEKEYNQEVYVTGCANNSITEKHRVAKGLGKVIEAGLNNQINIIFGTSSDQDDIKIPNWYCIKKRNNITNVSYIY